MENLLGDFSAMRVAGEGDFLVLKIGDKEQLSFLVACNVILSTLSCRATRLTFHSASFVRYDLVLIHGQLT